MSAISTWKRRLAAGGVVLVAGATLALAQVETTTTEKKGQPTKQVTVERGKVTYIAGNEIVVKMENGELRHITVPDNAKAIVDGKEIGLADLRVGMTLEKTITTTTTPKRVQTVKTGTGTVLNVQPPNYATLKFEDGSVERYKIPKATKFTIDGEQKTAFDLKPGMKITATRIIDVPMTMVSQESQVTGTAPPPPPTPPMEGALLIEAPTPAAAPAPAKAEPAPEPTQVAQALPKTGSDIPLLGLLGLLCLAASLGVRLVRRS
ncbi:MAG: LPXTG cell wall anchor domain-containing protein [Acidobacteria bacterium]|nr:MAG: LPXTG cell wall anchor domain-containing protein [Acidobacteriota bacterium]